MELIETILAVLSSPRHWERHLRFHTGLEEAVLVAESVSGYEAVDGGGYRFELTALSVEAGLDVGALLSRPVGVGATDGGRRMAVVARSCDGVRAGREQWRSGALSFDAGAVVEFSDAAFGQLRLSRQAGRGNCRGCICRLRGADAVVALGVGSDLIAPPRRS